MEEQGITILTPENIEKLIHKKEEEIKQIKEFIQTNPYPNISEMTKVIDKTIKKGLLAEPIRTFYWKDMVQKMYQNLYDEDVIFECGKKMSKVKSNKPKVARIVMMTNLHILQTVLEHNYDKNKKNTKYDRNALLAKTNEIDCIWDDFEEWQDTN